MGLAIAFWILAIVAIVAALGVIVQKNVFRAALSLIVCLVAVAGIFITLSADFLAGVQILVYVGAISVVIILAIMLTREFTRGSPSNRLRLPALVISAVFFGLTVFAVLNTDWQVSPEMPQTPTTPGLAEQLFGQNGFLLPLEISAVLILAVILGAIVIAREK
jgi:NADH:ubiquinone oxidoreductase subunit 6 (subunit J)